MTCGRADYVFAIMKPSAAMNLNRVGRFLLPVNPSVDLQSGALITKAQKRAGSENSASAAEETMCAWDSLQVRLLTSAATVRGCNARTKAGPVLGMTAAWSLLLASASAWAQTANEPASWQWRDARELLVEGKGWTDTKSYYDRLPARAENRASASVWNLSQDSAGMVVRFETDAPTIAARWVLRRSTLAMPHMPATGVSGLDLYVKEQGSWHWLANGRPEKTVTEQVLVRGLKPGRREYLVYLPLYNGVEELSLGVPKGVELSIAPSRSPGKKSIVFYGTSIVQGGCAARPGMAYPAILGRRLDRSTINLGFSGSALCEPELAEFFAELDPAAYVLDPLPNMTAELVAERLERFVLILRAAHPNTPIVLVEHLIYPDGIFVEARHKRYVEDNARLREVYDRFVKAGQKRLFLVPAARLIGTDGEATVDGTHPTDLGFVRMADAIEPVLRWALKSRP